MLSWLCSYCYDVCVGWHKQTESVFVFSQGCSDVSGFTQAVLGLVLPLGYEYDPSLVLLVRSPGSGLCDGAWQQLTGLLQGLAQGHTLVLMQVRRRRGVRAHLRLHLCCFWSFSLFYFRKVRRSASARRPRLSSESPPPLWGGLVLRCRRTWRRWRDWGADCRRTGSYCRQQGQAFQKV